MILSYYFGYWYDKRINECMGMEVGGMVSNDFVVDFFGKVVVLFERDFCNIIVYIFFVKEWEGLKDML